MDDEPKLLPSSSSEDIVPVNQSLSSLDPIQTNIYEKMRLAETPEEVQSYLNLLEQWQEQIEQRECSDFQLLEKRNQIGYERKIAVYKEIIANIFSIVSIVIGMLITKSIPLIAPLLIILGLIKPLGSSIGEVVELLRELTEFPEETGTKQEPSKLTDILRIGVYLSLLAIFLLLILIFVNIALEIQQVIVVVIGLLLFAAFSAFRLMGSSAA